MSDKPKIPKGWHELRKGTVISTDDMIWAWNIGPWNWVGGSIIGERYKRATSTSSNHWMVIRKR